MRVGAAIRGSIRRHLFSARSLKYHFIHIPKNGGVSIRRTLDLEPSVSLSTPYHYRYVDIADKVGRHQGFLPLSAIHGAARHLATCSRNSPPGTGPSDPRRQYLLKASFADYVRDQAILPIPEHPGQPWMASVRGSTSSIGFATSAESSSVIACAWKT